MYLPILLSSHPTQLYCILLQLYWKVYRKFQDTQKTFQTVWKLCIHFGKLSECPETEYLKIFQNMWEFLRISINFPHIFNNISTVSRMTNGTQTYPEAPVGHTYRCDKIFGGLNLIIVINLWNRISQINKNSVQEYWTDLSIVFVF